MINDETLIQNTVARLYGAVERDHLLIVTTRVQQPHLGEQLPHVPPSQIIFEPRGRNTAPAIGLAALYLLRLDADAVMIVAPADHHITQTESFYQAVRTAVELVDRSVRHVRH